MLFIIGFYGVVVYFGMPEIWDSIKDVYITVSVIIYLITAILGVLLTNIMLKNNLDMRQKIIELALKGREDKKRDKTSIN